MALSPTWIQTLLSGPSAPLREQAFEVLAGISALGSDGAETLSGELLIRALDRREEFDGAFPILDSLVRRYGLFPYIREPALLGTADKLAYEIHRPVGAEDLVFHAKQAEVYRLLAQGHNVVLSAPTSFGKSLIIDAVIATGNFRCIVIIVPTIALIDETRRRLTRRFRSEYKIVTHPGQAVGDKTIYVLTQERFLDIPVDRLPQVDFFAIDEFYKLDSAQNEDRAGLLNQAFHRLHASGAQFYLLGPNIDNIASELAGRLNFQFIRSDFQTVALDTEIHRVKKGQLQEAVIERCRTLTGPTLLYVKSPRRAREIAGWLLAAGLTSPSKVTADAADWVTQAYHPEWLVAKALRQGIGIHHGRMPRALAHHMVRLFNDGRLPWLIVTSTLIEGVNTIARNVVIVDNKVATRNLDFFTYNNIRGRPGRMFKYFVGKVVMYGEPPTSSPKTVDIPAYSQGPDTPTSLLIQLPWNELTPSSRERLLPYYQQQLVSLDTIRAAAGIDPEAIVGLAAKLHSNPAFWSTKLAWTGPPTKEQLLTVCDLVYELSGSRGMRNGVASGRQLATRLGILRQHHGQVAPMAIQQMSFNHSGPDEAVEDVLDFVRQWTGHLFPRLLMTVQSITEDVFRRYNLPTGDYRHYATSVEAQFRPPILTVLEEYGLPASVTERLLHLLPPVQAISLDDVLTALRQIGDVPGLSQFEREMLKDTIAGL